MSENNENKKLKNLLLKLEKINFDFIKFSDAWVYV